MLELNLFAGKLGTFDSRVICAYLGIPNHPIHPLKDFIYMPDYKAIRDTFCVSGFKATWARHPGKYRRNKSLRMGNFTQKARVWLRLLNYRIMPFDHYTDVSKERVYIVYFIMMGQPVNIGYWMLQEMIKVLKFKSKRLSFGNTLTAYLLKIDNTLPRHDQLRKMAVITDERFELDFPSLFIKAPHTTHFRALLRDKSRMPIDEDVNSVDLMEVDAEAEDE
ncbi:hypothetical protein RND71_008542 [Anisodus tanguticus]|uniref:Putative plant transposon protein domain-containing protein n=1 Tax=Anisodus tanguticus TaxID=243964 RepID=A0AAE1SPA0_9SOLA|nr:hypothetical protein RND71_008542 [Anisodus tanguticus]